MIRCKIEPVNLYSSQDEVLRVQYVPYSVSTLKLLVTNLEDMSIEMKITPLIAKNDQDCCCGFDDLNKGLIILWGGGIEDGVKLSLRPKASSYAYFFLFHTVPEISPYNLTLMSKMSIGYAAKTRDEQRIKIELVPMHKNMEAVKCTFSSDKSIVSFQGRFISYYYPRWFPELYPNLLPKEGLLRDTGQLGDLIQVQINRSDGGKNDFVSVKTNYGKNLGIIKGDMDGADFHCELYCLSQDIYVIRVWFFWISKTRYKNKHNLDMIYSDRERGLTDPELPDCERFDFVFGKSGNVLFVGTDFHWQEYWYTLKRTYTSVEGLISKYVYPIEETISRLMLKLVSTNTYQNIIMKLMYLGSKEETRENIQDECSELTSQMLFRNLSDKEPRDTKCAIS